MAAGGEAFAFIPDNVSEEESAMPIQTTKPMPDAVLESGAWSDRPGEGRASIAIALNELLADFFALYLKTKNFHSHVSGPHFRDYHLLFDEQAAQILATTDVLAERVRKIGQSTLRSVGQVARLQRLADNEAEHVEPASMLSELRRDNAALAEHMRQLHDLCDQHRDLATASLLENWLDEAEQRSWFLYEASRPG